MTRRMWQAALVGIAALALGLGVVIGLNSRVTVSTGVGSSESPSMSVAPTLPATVDGLPVLSVGQVLAARAQGGLRKQPVAVGGYCSYDGGGHMCAPPEGRPGALEIYCHDGEYGITERDEPIFVAQDGKPALVAAGPHLTPWVSDAILTKILSAELVNGRLVLRPTAPIVVVGHFDDPRAADCRPQARKLCADRLVIDRVAVFLPPPAPTPEPSGPSRVLPSG